MRGIVRCESTNDFHESVDGEYIRKFQSNITQYQAILNECIFKILPQSKIK